jgi:hypothetical protein
LHEGDPFHEGGGVAEQPVEFLLEGVLECEEQLLEIAAGELAAGGGQDRPLCRIKALAQRKTSGWGVWELGGEW